MDGPMFEETEGVRPLANSQQGTEALRPTFCSDLNPADNHRASLDTDPALVESRDHCHPGHMSQL